MRQSEVFPYYRKMVKDLSEIYAYMKSEFNKGYCEELCAMRGYVSDEQKNLINELEIGYCDLDVSLLGENANYLGLVTQSGNFLLANRFQIPLYDYAGNLISIVGYYPDSRKYITLSTPFFSKDILFFNFRQAFETAWGKYNGTVILVEGIFDCLSLRSIGLPAIATMGSTVSKIKGEQLKYFRKVIAIPDDDEVGRASLDRYSRKGWKVPANTTMIRFRGGVLHMGDTVVHCKDMDNFVSWYEPDDVIECLMQFADSHEDIEDLAL